MLLVEDALSCAAACHARQGGKGEVLARLREVEVPQVQSIDGPNTHDDLEAGFYSAYLASDSVGSSSTCPRCSHRKSGHYFSSPSLLAVTCSVSGRCAEFKVQYGKVHGVDEEPVRFDIFLAKVDVDRTNRAENV